MKNREEQLNKFLLNIEVFIGIIISLFLLVVILLSYYLDVEEEIKILLIICGLIPFIIGMFICFKIEQIAGYYECKCCHHKYIPKFKSVFWAMHFGRTIYMKCSECNKRSWQKKVITK